MTLDINEGTPVDLCGEPGVVTLPDPFFCDFSQGLLDQK